MPALTRGTSGARWCCAAPTRAAPAGLPWWLLGVHSARLDVGTRDRSLDEALGLNYAWYSDVLADPDRGSSGLRAKADDEPAQYLRPLPASAYGESGTAAWGSGGHHGQDSERQQRDQRSRRS